MDAEIKIMHGLTRKLDALDDDDLAIVARILTECPAASSAMLRRAAEVVALVESASGVAVRERTLDWLKGKCADLLGPGGLEKA